MRNPPTRIRTLIQRLETAFEKAGITKVELATRTGLHNNTLLGFAPKRAKTKKVWSPQVSTIEALERYLLPPLAKPPKRTNRR